MPDTYNASLHLPSRLPKLPKSVKDANWLPTTDGECGGGGTNLLALVFELARGCGEQFSRDPYLIPAVDSVDGKQGGNSLGSHKSQIEKDI